MTVVTMSLFPSPAAQAPGPHVTGPGLTIRPPHSILSASLTAKSSQSLLAASQAKGKLGFSIDSIVGDRERSPKRETASPQSPASRDRSPLYRGRSPSPGEDLRRSPRSDSPASPGSLVRPIPTSGAASVYLDQLAQLKAFYDSRGAAQAAAAQAAAAGLAAPSPPSGHGAPPTSLASPGLPGLPPGLGLPGLHHAAVLSALPRPPASLPAGLPPFLGLPGQHPNLPGQQLPREYPLYPWFLNRNRFPGGPPGLPEFLLPFRKPKRIRTAFSPSQLLKLEQAFEKNQYVVGQERKELAKTLNLSETQVKVWFQNRRTKHKREETETDQAKALGGGETRMMMGEGGQTIIEHDESEEEDIDCE